MSISQTGIHFEPELQYRDSCESATPATTKVLYLRYRHIKMNCKSKSYVVWFLIISIVSLSLFPGCEDELREVKQEYSVSYVIDGTVAKCSVSYTNWDNSLITVVSADLPWEMTVAVPADSSIRLLLSGEAGKEDVFIPVLEGTTSGYADHRLLDSTAAFLSMVKEGDSVFIAGEEYPYAQVTEVISDTELRLTRDQFSAGNETYGIYREKTLDLVILVDGEEVCSSSDSDLFLLSAVAIGTLK